MTTRLIEECLESEDEEELFKERWGRVAYFLVDPRLISKEELAELQNPIPGKLILMERKQVVKCL